MKCYEPLFPFRATHLTNVWFFSEWVSGVRSLMILDFFLMGFPWINLNRWWTCYEAFQDSWTRTITVRCIHFLPAFTGCFVYLCFFATKKKPAKSCVAVCVFHLHWALGGVDTSVALSKKTQSGGEKKRLTPWSDFFGFMLNISSLHCFSRKISDESSKYGWWKKSC